MYTAKSGSLDKAKRQHNIAVVLARRSYFVVRQLGQTGASFVASVKTQVQRSADCKTRSISIATLTVIWGSFGLGSHCLHSSCMVSADVVVPLFFAFATHFTVCTVWLVSILPTIGTAGQAAQSNYPAAACMCARLHTYTQSLQNHVTCRARQ